MKLLLVIVVAMFISGCDQEPRKGRMLPSMIGPAIERYHEPQLVAQGEAVYRLHCAECHGASAEGHPTWRKRDAEGMFPPPPLNGTGHAWHHSRQWLRDMILDGSEPGRGRMPAWRGKVSEAEAEAVIEWFQSRWPDPVYVAWYEARLRNGEL